MTRRRYFPTIPGPSSRYLILYRVLCSQILSLQQPPSPPLDPLPSSFSFAESWSCRDADLPRLPAARGPAPQQQKQAQQQPCTPPSAARRHSGGVPCPRSRPRCSSSSRRRWGRWPRGCRRPPRWRRRGSTRTRRGWGSGRRGPRARRRGRSSRRPRWGRSTRRTRGPPAPVARRTRVWRLPSWGSRPRSSIGSPRRASPSCSPFSLSNGLPDTRSHFGSICGIANGHSGTGTQFWDEKMEKELAEGHLSSTVFDRWIC
ncbi:dynactin, 150 kDa isoform-like isoform X2 [Panicum virgatum]|uniref:dynactin, 150 kDa isoform-like isoform X2 n=1 Tax=Panicum virgatum TaxID=38727 RepID=UPI0019D54AEF|nr:dynactin, 150 kDa isoform-like isoform X2 [Panicum virgatum]